jgi:hypothetical protein
LEPSLYTHIRFHGFKPFLVTSTQSTCYRISCTKDEPGLIDEQKSIPVEPEKAYQTFNDTWSPRIVAGVDNYDVKTAKVEGPYVWHAHETDEFFWS